MGFKDLFARKDSDINNNVTEEIHEQNSDYKLECDNGNLEEETKEMAKNNGKNKTSGKTNSNDKKKYIYLAFEPSGDVALDSENNPIFSHRTEDCQAAQWPNSENYICDKEYREEVNLNEKKERANEKARKTLMKRAECLISEARKMRELEKDKEEINQNEEEKIENSVENIEQTEQSLLENGENVEEIENNRTGDEEKQERKIEEKQECGGVMQEQNEVVYRSSDKIIEEIRKNGEDLNNDIVALYDDISQEIELKGKANGEKILNAINDMETNMKLLVEKIRDDASKSIVRDSKSEIKESKNLIISSIEKVKKEIKEEIATDIKRNTKEGQDKLSSKLTKLSHLVDDTIASCETIEGRTKKIDDILQVLSDKGVVISSEIPPVNAEEEDIINLVRYSQKISEQLGFAARELIRRKAAFDNQEKGNINEQQAVERKISEARQEGVAKGKFETIKAILTTVNGADSLINSDNNYVSAIWNSLKELGVEIDGDEEYQKDNEIDLQDISEKMLATYSGLSGEGKYKVTKTGLVFANEILIAAEFEKIENSDCENVEQEEYKDCEETNEGMDTNNDEAVNDENNTTQE